MAKRRRGNDERDYVNPEDLFAMSLVEFRATWGLTELEILEELRSARLVAVGTNPNWSAAKIRLPMLRAWVACKDLPPAVRMKVDAAGAFDRLEAFRRDQIHQCFVDPINNRMQLPDGTVLRDVQVRAVSRH